MTAKYDRLAAFLDDQAGDEPVSLTINEISDMVGGLPASASQRTWWANTTGHSQALAWLRTGRRVVEVRPGEAVVFSPADGDVPAGPGRTSRRRGNQAVLDGVAALRDIVARAGYESIVAAVAAHTLFLHPETVAQAGTGPLFPVVRDPNRRGQLGALPDGRKVLFDDNTTPSLAFLWAARRSKGPDVQYNHVWGDPRNVETYTALWNLCVTPAFLAKTTDGSNHPEVLTALRYRAFDLYGRYPDGEQPPDMPGDYHSLEWPDPPERVDDLEATLRARLRDAPKCRAAVAARELGWAFSAWEPDPTVSPSSG
ncbi:MAG TPA: hypothetical protein VFP54_04565 [Acidimicrobiales bacterium]|nr:hypothetical protein [Acidimicrobiales bacterium]